MQHCDSYLCQNPALLAGLLKTRRNYLTQTLPGAALALSVIIVECGLSSGQVHCFFTNASELGMSFSHDNFIMFKKLDWLLPRDFANNKCNSFRSIIMIFYALYITMSKSECRPFQIWRQKYSQMSSENIT